MSNLNRVNRIVFPFIGLFFSFLLVYGVLNTVQAASEKHNDVAVSSDTPASGVWSGVTSEGLSVNFTVNSSGTHVIPFEIRYIEYCDSVTQTNIFRTVVVGDGPGYEIIGETFEISGWTGSFTGTFQSSVVNVGSYSTYRYDENRGICEGSGTWVAFPEAQTLRAYLPILFNDYIQ